MEEEDEKEKPLAIAIVGRPNVGESLGSWVFVCLEKKKIVWGGEVSQPKGM
jgi:predicted GTPase